MLASTPADAVTLVMTVMMSAVHKPPATWRPVFAMALPWAIMSFFKALTPHVFTGMFASDWPADCSMQNSATTKMGVFTVESESRDRAPVMRARPTIEMARGPNLSNTTPEIGLMMMPTAAAGSMAMPVSKAEAPSEVCSSNGNSVLVTRHAALMSVTMMAATRNSRVLSVPS